MNSDHIMVARMHEDAVMPVRSSSGAGAWDLAACVDLVITSFGVTAIPTGLVFQVPDGYSIHVIGRSSTLTKLGVFIHPGIVDADYRGEIIMQAINVSSTPVRITKGQRVGQMWMEKLLLQYLYEVNIRDLTVTVRGIGGFGSTGTH